MFSKILGRFEDFRMFSEKSFDKSGILKKKVI